MNDANGPDELRSAPRVAMQRDKTRDVGSCLLPEVFADDQRRRVRIARTTNVDNRLGDDGLEPHSLTGGDNKHLEKRTERRAAKSGAETAQNAPDPADRESIDPELAAVVEAWPTLPEAIRAGIVAMVKVSEDG